MQPKHKHTSTADPGPDDGQDAPRTGIVSPERQEGQRRADERACRYQGFTSTLPTAGQACLAIHATARRGPLGKAASHTLEVLLHLLPQFCWAELPVLRVTNATLASRVGCSRRQVQRHLAILHEHGAIGINWGRGHTRLGFQLHADHKATGPSEPDGIDLRPTLVYAHEQAELARSVLAAQQQFSPARERALAAVWQAKTALIHAAERLAPARYATAGQQIEQLRTEIGQLARAALGARALPAGIEAATQAAGKLAGRALALRQEIETDDEDDTGDNGPESSPQDDESASQMTESNFVESVVLTIQAGPDRAGLRPAGATGKEGQAEVGEAGPQGEPALPVLYARWLGAYDGRQPLPSGELTELEITARLQAKQYGIAHRMLDQAAARHGLALVIGAVLFVAGLPEHAGIRNRGALLASLLQRPAGGLTPDSFRRRQPEATPLGEAEALAIAKRLAPGHQPHWVFGRWQATQQRRKEPITDPRACLAGFARKLQREHGGFARAG
ncbi:MAG: helix-turn-helix domain-containing protein [Geminicoccaceae bacterium]